MDSSQYRAFNLKELLVIYRANDVDVPSDLQRARCQAILEEANRRRTEKGLEPVAFLGSEIDDASGHPSRQDDTDISSSEVSRSDPWIWMIVVAGGVLLLLPFLSPAVRSKVINVGVAGALVGTVVTLGLFALKYLWAGVGKAVGSDVVKKAVEGSAGVAKGTGRGLVGGTSPVSSDGDDDAFYEQALDELGSGETSKPAYARALVLSDGNEQRLKAEYIKLRVAQLQEDRRRGPS